MSKLSIESKELSGVVLINTFFVEDARGNTVKNFEHLSYLDIGVDFIPTESLVIRSNQGTLRGLHFQRKNSQSRLITCLQGEIFVVAVNVCANSCQYGQYTTVRMSSEMKKALYVPGKYALGTLAMESSLIHCLCDGHFCAEEVSGIRWDDEDLCIKWPLDELNILPVISNKDLALPSLKEFEQWGMKKYEGNRLYCENINKRRHF